MRITAAVIQEADAPFIQAPLELQEPRSGEILVRILVVGICHTDIVAKQGGLPSVTFPAVLGHEGAGIVERVGDAVTKFKVGDRVLLSFMSCGRCPCCSDGDPAYCQSFPVLNLSGLRPDGSGSLHDSGGMVFGSFFSQSSFATHALAQERNAVIVPPEVPLEIAGILGCGVQTGAGAVLRSLNCKPEGTILITGGGAVGLSAVMAAKLRGLSRIVLSEYYANRRELALELGATDVIDPSAGNLGDQVLGLLSNGVDYVVDTTGIPAVVEQLPRVMSRRGKLGVVGIPPASHPNLQLPGTLMDTMRRGLTIRGIIEGDSDLDPFIGYLMNMYMEGRFPFDKLVRTYPMSQINEAIEAQYRGECVKVVLLP